MFWTSDPTAASLGGPDERDCEHMSPTPHQGILGISPTKILLTLLVMNLLS